MYKKFPSKFQFLAQPYPFQEETVAFGIRHKQFAFFLGLGLGKTFCAINVARCRIQRDSVKKILVVAPTSVLYKWEKEILKFSEYKAIVLHGDRKERLDRFLAFQHDSNLRFGMINYEALQPFIHPILDMGLDMIIADESSRYIRNVGRHRTNALIQLGDTVKYKGILTGTPIANKAIGLWPQFRFLDSGNLFGKNFYAWRAYFFAKREYTSKNGVFSTWVPKEYRLPIMYGRINQVSITYKNQDVLDDLPPITYDKIEIVLPPTLRNDYDSLRQKMISEIKVELGNARINIPNVLSRIVRLQQFTSGFIRDENKLLRRLEEKPKLDALLEQIDEVVDADSSVIVWCRFKESISMISEELDDKNIKYITMSGDDVGKEKDKKWNLFQKDKTIQVFVGQVTSGGIGIELFKLNASREEYQHMIFYENTFVLDDRTQAIGRSADRIGQNAKVRIIDLLVRDSVDEKILSTIMENKRIADMILEYRNNVENII